MGFRRCLYGMRHMSKYGGNLMSAKSVDVGDRNYGAKARHHKAIVAVVAVVAVVAAVFVGKPAYERYCHEKAVSKAIDTDTFYSGIVVQGVDLGGKTMDQAEKAVDKALSKTHYDIKVTYGGKNWELTEKDITFSYDTENVLKDAYSYARSGDREERYKLVTALGKKNKKYEITGTLDEKNLESKLKSITESISYPAQEPQVTGFSAGTGTFSTADGKTGISADESKLLSDVKNIINGPKTGNAGISVKTVGFKLTLSKLRSRLGELGTYSTVSKNSAAGTYNMSLALSKVNGVCVKNGGTFSFLGVVGACDGAHGYQKAGAILDGKLIQQYGGGICQASTTVYGAALRSGMKITERSNHTIPSGYCPIGQDATVSYPSLDLKFKNTSGYPVYIVTRTAGKTLTATLYGYLPPEYDTITISSEITQTIPAPSTPKYTVDATLAKGTVKFVSKARNGYKVKAERTYYKAGKAVKTESLPSSYYKAQQAAYSYGKGTAVNGGGQSSSSPSRASSENRNTSGTTSGSGGSSQNQA